MSRAVIVEKVEERRTSTTIQAVFKFHLTSPKSDDFSVDLPFPTLGWKFALSLSRQGQKKGKTTSYNWSPITFSFRQHDSSVPWGNTSLQAQLSLAFKQHDLASVDTTSSFETEGTMQNNMGPCPMPIATLQAILSRNSSVVLPLMTAGFVSLQEPTKIWLNVTISGCPFSNGFFRTDLADRLHEAAAYTGLVRQCGDRFLARSLATGKFFDVKFLAPSARTGKIKKLRTTYTSLLVLEQKIDLQSSKLGDEWQSALLAPKRNDKADIKLCGEILCPDGYEHDLDSDLDDDEGSDEASSITELCAPVSAIDDSTDIRRDQKSHSDCSTERSDTSGSASSFELYQPEEIIQDSVEPHHETDDSQRTFLVKFAAHRTWRAFLWYCYTGHVEFNSLKSQRDVRRPDIEDGPPPCSPKSMYRLADLVGNKELKNEALKAIGERMNEKNILEETFSVFTSKFPDVRRAQMNILLKHISSPEVKGAFVDAMKNFANTPHVEPVLLALCDRLVAVEH